MAAGASAADKAAAARRAAARKQREADAAAHRAEAWASGAAGEERVAAIVSALAADGYHHLPDRALSGTAANVDHLLVGPSGVFVLDAKAWSGEISVEGGVLRQDGRRRTTEIESARLVADLVAGALERNGCPSVPVRPALVFVGGTSVAPTSLQRVKIISGEQVVGWIRSRPVALEPASVDHALRVLANEFPAKVADDVAGVPVEPPDELVVYLVPWKRAGRHRLYVRSSEGHDVGYLDLVTGDCSSASEEWRAILAQLLPHYLKGDTPGMRSGDLSSEAHGVIRRFLDAFLGERPQSRPPERPIIACYRWTRHGKDRLYLSRVEPGREKVELGSFDLDTGRLHANGPGMTATLGYCGQRFQELEQQRLPLG